MTIAELEAEVQRRAADRMPDVIMGLFDIGYRVEARCLKHRRLLLEYIGCQILLTRAKRNLRRTMWNTESEGEFTRAYSYVANRTAARDRVRAEFHNQGCSCWVA